MTDSCKPMPIPATAAILAGGGSRRMGRDKASLPWGDVPLGIFVARRLSAWFEEVIVSSDRPGPFEGSAFRRVPDVHGGAGTLGGLHGALSAARTEWLFLTACDMPFVREGLVRFLWGLKAGADAIVPVTADGPEPACAYYSARCLEPASRSLEAGRFRVISFFEEVRVRFVAEAEWAAHDPRGESFVNLNTPGEYETLRPR